MKMTLKISLMIVASLSSVSAYAEFQKMCFIQYADYTEVASVDLQTKRMKLDIRTGNANFSQEVDVRTVSLTQTSIGAQDWNWRINTFVQGANRSLDLSAAYEVIKMNNDSIDSGAAEMWLIRTKNGQKINVLATAGVFQYYVCP